TQTSSLSLHDALPIFNRLGWHALKRPRIPPEFKAAASRDASLKCPDRRHRPALGALVRDNYHRRSGQQLFPQTLKGAKSGTMPRSEEHTSELQSRENL